ncbi:MAG TPA: AbrB/MazE/SpoVT family DNA-binding domain-containing protein [archaeon]|nr:AbrB/MazE/SpoVT family DNA-binding domain-containing protein [archaeon]
MIKQQMKVGPKGQVVIPQLIRESTGVKPGSLVVVELTKKGILIELPRKSENLELLAEGYRKNSKRDIGITREFSAVDSEGWREW